MLSVSGGHGPRAQCFQHEMLTSVSEGRHGEYHTYALRDVCMSCHTVLNQQEAQRRTWWVKFWMWAFVGNLIFTAFVPVSIYPWVAALLVRGWWKRRAKRQQRLTPGQTAQQVPRAAAPSAASEVTKSDTSS